MNMPPQNIPSHIVGLRIIPDMQKPSGSICEGVQPASWRGLLPVLPVIAPMPAS